MEEPQKFQTINNNEDRLSNLPDHLIQRILGLLPDNEAIRTCVLSKQWRFTGTSIGFMHRYGHQYWCDRDFATFIETTLNHYFTNLIVTVTMCVSLDSISHRYKDHMELFVKHGLSFEIKDVCIQFSREWVYGRIDSAHELPLCFYDHNPFMRKLSLQCCLFGALPKAVSWVSLRVLLLYEVIGLSNDTLGAIFSGSPVLECLILYKFRCIDVRIRIDSTRLKVLVLNHLYVPESSITDPVVIEISCPNLSLLAIMGRVEFMPLYGGPAPFSCLKWALLDVSSLVEARIDFDLSKHDVVDAQCWSDFKCFFVDDLFRKLNHVGRLTIGTDCNEFLSKLDLSNELLKSQPVTCNG